MFSDSSQVKCNQSLLLYIYILLLNQLELEQVVSCTYVVYHLQLLPLDLLPIYATVGIAILLFLIFGLHTHIEDCLNLQFF